MNSLTLFIGNLLIPRHADKKYRIKRIINDYGIAPNMAEKELERKDRDRTNYCKHYTHRIWGMASNYNLAIDSSLFGPEKSAMLIIEALHKYIGKE